MPWRLLRSLSASSVGWRGHLSLSPSVLGRAATRGQIFGFCDVRFLDGGWRSRFLTGVVESDPRSEEGRAQERCACDLGGFAQTAFIVLWHPALTCRQVVWFRPPPRKVPSAASGVQLFSSVGWEVWIRDLPYRRAGLVPSVSLPLHWAAKRCPLCWRKYCYRPR